MPKIAGDPLTKITLNLYEADVNWFQEKYGRGWSTQLREFLHNNISMVKSLAQAGQIKSDFDFEEGEF